MFIALLLAASTVSGTFDLKGIPLGISINDFKSSAVDGARYKAGRVLCSDEHDEKYLRIDEREKRAGVVRCAVMELIGTSMLPSSIQLTPDISVTAEFYFWRGKLARIEAYPDYVDNGIVINGIAAKFGHAKERSSTARNGLGVEIRQDVYVWGGTGQTIIATAPDLNVRKMSVIYTDNSAQAEISNTIKALYPPQDAM